MDARLACVCEAPLFRGISLGDCAYIAAQAQERQLLRQEVLFRQGDTRRHLFVIASGHVKVTQLSPAGNEVILWLKGPGEIVDGNGLAPAIRRDSGAQAVEACSVLYWDVKVIESLAERFALLHRNMVSILSDSLHHIQARYHELATEKVAGRLARTLLRLLGRPAGEIVRIILSREELAQMTGTTLFAVSRLLAEWTQRGIIDARREAILVKSDSGLLELIGEKAAA